MSHVSRITYHASRLLNNIDLGLLLATLLTLFIIQSLLQPGLPTAADMAIHLYRTMEYTQAWAPGVIVPRWAPNLAYGYGYPLFVFAPPLPYFFGLTFHLMGFTVEVTLKFLIILTILLYATGMYLLVRDVLDSIGAGLVAAIAYTFAPFALREVLLYGGNVPQFLAIGLFPWTLWAMTRATFARSWGWMVLAAILYAGVLLSHLFQAFVFTPVVGVYGIMLYLGSGAETWRRIGTEGKGYHPFTFITPIFRFLPLLTIPLGLLLSAFFWIPAFAERFFTHAQAGIYLEKSPFFVRYPHWTELVAWIQPLDARAANPYAPLTLGVVTLGLAALGLLSGIWLLVTKRQTTVHGRGEAEAQRCERKSHLVIPTPLLPGFLVPFIIFFFALVAATATFMTLPASRPVWETVSILQVAEFPWRMLGLANLGLAFLAGTALILVPIKIRPAITACCVLVQIVTVAPYLYPVTAFTQYGQPTLADQVDYERRSQSVGTTTLGEYLPQTVGQPPTTSPLVDTFGANQIPNRLDLDSLPPEASATLLKQNATTHIYRLDSPTGFTLRLFQFDYLGWRAWLDDQPANITPEAETGLILIEVPAGQYTLTVHFGETPGRIVAMLLSGLTVVGLVIAGVYVMRSKKVEEQKSEGEIPPVPLSPCSAAHRPIKLGTILFSVILIIVITFWLKPLLRPLFTLKSPADQALPAQHKAGIDFENGIRLIGYDLDKTVVAPGERLQVVLYWQTNAAPHRTNLQPFVHLDRLDDWTTIADATNYTPGDVTTESNLPTFHWDNDRYVRDEHDLIVPPTIPPLAYAVRVGLINPDRRNHLLPLANGIGDTAQLTTINVFPPGRPRVGLTHQLDISLGNDSDTIYVTGFELDSLTPERLDFTLTWQSDTIPQNNYIVFAQLLDMGQNLAASFDGPPLAGAYPTSTWLPGQTIVDPRYIPLSSVAPGDYRLIVGMYDPLTRQRLTTVDGTDFIELTKIPINEP